MVLWVCDSYLQLHALNYNSLIAAIYHSTQRNCLIYNRIEAALSVFSLLLSMKCFKEESPFCRICMQINPLSSLSIILEPQGLKSYYTLLCSQLPFLWWLYSRYRQHSYTIFGFLVYQQRIIAVTIFGVQLVPGQPSGRRMSLCLGGSLSGCYAGHVCRDEGCMCRKW